MTNSSCSRRSWKGTEIILPPSQINDCSLILNVICISPKAIRLPVQDVSFSAGAAGTTSAHNRHYSGRLSYFLSRTVMTNNFYNWIIFFPKHITSVDCGMKPPASVEDCSSSSASAAHEVLNVQILTITEAP